MMTATMGLNVAGVMTQVAVTSVAALVVVSCFATFGFLSATLYR